MAPTRLKAVGRWRLAAACTVLVLVCSALALAAWAAPLADPRFVPASAELRSKCRTTAVAVGYPAPCPMRVPAGLAAFGGRPGCELDIIGPAKPCPNTAFLWRGWIVGSSRVGDQHLVLVASPRALEDYAKVVNGPAWYRGARVRALKWVTVNGRRMREVYVPPDTNDGSAFAGHVVLIWTVAGHTYAIGFHNVNGFDRTLTMDLKLARGITLVRP